MRTATLLLCLLSICISSYAGTRIGQNSWRWRHNDGSETTATWMQPQSTSIQYTTANGVIRLRIELINASLYYKGPSNGGMDFPVSHPIPASVYDSLQFSLSPLDLSSWIAINNDSSKAFMLAGPLATVTQGQRTTPQITGDTSAFSPGVVMVSSNIADCYIAASGRTEVEWALRGTAYMLPNTKYYFRQQGTTRLHPGSYELYPSLTTGSNAPLPVKLTNFSVKKEDRKVRVEWATASEENSDHFEILRSADGQSWQRIAQQPSRGNATNPANYSAYDDNPLAGLNYYRLKQVDKDGKASLSEVKSLRLFANASVSIWPNPVSSVINFSLQQPEAKLVATLQDATGRTVHQQSFTNLQAGAVNKVALAQKLRTGVYVLKLEADGFSETRKIIIQ